MIGILTEKPSAMRNLVKALGFSGQQGTYNGEKCIITAARGHLYKFPNDPEDQVKDKSLHLKYHTWKLENLPWNEKDFDWTYEMAKDASGTLSQIKSVLSQCDEVCIATDVDPTGEGELLAWEILDQLHIRPKKFSRMYFTDESEKEFQKAFVNRKPIKSMLSDPDYVKAFYRARWDYLSMQFSRIATICGDGHSILRQGRLKSAMVVLVGDALKALKEYKKIPYYQNKFKDENGVVYTNPDEPSFPDKKQVPQSYHASDVVLDGKSMKSTAPPKLLDLSTLSARLARQGYAAKDVLDVYQKMYEAQIVSYPRTEDKVITPEQFNDLLPLVNKIAAVVGVDSKLLTHRTPRATHVKKGGAHGANRPGPKVPASLQSLSSFDTTRTKGCAAAIYELLAKNYLATLAEDYQYESQKGHVKDYPDFKGTASVPKSMGWKQVYDADSDPDSDENAKGIGTSAEPFVYEGFPPKPPTPTMKWLMAQLEKRDVGTGATRTSTYSDVTTARNYPLLKDTKGKITMERCGEMSYYLLLNTNIGSLDITKAVMNDMKDIADGKKDPEQCLHDMQRLVTEDIETMKNNSIIMRKELGVMGNVEKCTGTWNGQEVSFKKVWGGHEFTDEECEKLLNGETITITYTNKDGNEAEATGSLAEQEYKGKTFYGFKMDPSANSNNASNTERWSGVFNGKNISFKRNWGGHYFTDEECEKLIAGERISFPATAKSGNDYTAEGILAEQEFKGRTFYGFMLDNNKGSSGSNQGIPKVWCKHEFTDDERLALESGLFVERDDFVSKKGSTFAAKIHYGKTDRGTMGIVAEFG